MRYPLILGALMGIVVSGLFLPPWIVIPLFFGLALYIPSIPLMVVLGMFVAFCVWVFLDDDYIPNPLQFNDDNFYGSTRLVPIGKYKYPYPNPHIVPGPRLVAIWNNPDYIAAYKRVYG